jgi:DNA mismatch endonuclease (patch repair protein)
MRGNRSKDTKPEAALRSELHRRGLRFRKHATVVPGLRCRPDVVFPRARVAVECRGCFWHLCSEDAVLPKSNRDYWLPKLERNVARDRRNELALADAGWTLVIVWEHDDVAAAADRIDSLIRSTDVRTGTSAR